MKSLAGRRKEKHNLAIDDCRLANQFLVNKFGAKLSTATRDTQDKVFMTMLAE